MNVIKKGNVETMEVTCCECGAVLEIKKRDLVFAGTLDDSGSLESVLFSIECPECTCHTTITCGKLPKHFRSA